MIKLIEKSTKMSDSKFESSRYLSIIFLFRILSNFQRVKQSIERLLSAAGNELHSLLLWH